MAIKSSDQISIVDLTDGYSVILTNDSFNFAGGVSAAVAGSTTTTVIAMCGGNQVPASVNNSNIVAPTGVTTSVDTDPTQPTITISIANTVTEGGVVDIPVSIDNGNITIHKMFTFQISFRGQTGYSAQWYSGTGITGTSTTATAFSSSGVANAQVGDMYLNTSTMNTYRCTVGGAAASAKWVYVGNIKGQTGDVGPGAVWYTGTKITGTSTTATAFSGSGITAAKVGDMYLNTSTYNTYRCTVGGAASAAKWVYVSNIKGGKGDTGDPGADAITMTVTSDAITMTVTSSNGTIFKNTAVVTTLTAHVYKAGTELTAAQIEELGTIKWYKDGASTAMSTTGATLNISSGDVTNKATYIAQLEG